MNRIFSAALVALSLGAAVVASATPAAAGHGWNAAVVGGLAAGVLVGGAIAANAGPAYAVAPDYDEGACYLTRRPVVNAWGEVVGYRRVRVCD